MVGDGGGCCGGGLRCVPLFQRLCSIRLVFAGISQGVFSGLRRVGQYVCVCIFDKGSKIYFSGRMTNDDGSVML